MDDGTTPEALVAPSLDREMIESVVMASLGGVCGIVIGLAGSIAGSLALHLPVAADPCSIAVAVLFSAAVGVGFGYFLARRPARLDPIEALRHE